MAWSTARLQRGIVVRTDKPTSQEEWNQSEEDKSDNRGDLDESALCRRARFDDTDQGDQLAEQQRKQECDSDRSQQPAEVGGNEPPGLDALHGLTKQIVSGERNSLPSAALIEATTGCASVTATSS